MLLLFALFSWSQGSHKASLFTNENKIYRPWWIFPNQLDIWEMIFQSEKLPGLTHQYTTHVLKVPNKHQHISQLTWSCQNSALWIVPPPPPYSPKQNKLPKETPPTGGVENVRLVCNDDSVCGVAIDESSRLSKY